MSNNDGFLCCAVNIEWLNRQGIVQRKLAHKQANLRLIRNERLEMFVEISADKVAPIKLQLKGISVHKKFMSEGKASIKFEPLNCMLYLSNAPPGSLLTFLRTLFVKMTGGKTGPNANTSLRTQLLSNKRQQFEEISPVTNVEMDKARMKASRGTDTTPSPLASKKRKLERDSSGKTPVAKKLIIGALPPDVTAATASTGVAACHIGGTTLHKFAGIGSDDTTLERSIELASKSATASIWRKCRHLIIDEISMVEGDYFEKIEIVARRLPPVTKSKFGEKTPAPKFCFKTKAWESCRLTTFELRKVHRQNDDYFIGILNKIRKGQADKELQDYVHIPRTDLTNETKLKALPGDSKVFEAQDSIPGTSKLLDQHTHVVSRLELKIGAQVMLLKNINIGSGLVNGARDMTRIIPLGPLNKQLNVGKSKSKTKKGLMAKSKFMDKPLMVIS
ncbi:hypothetical protein NQ317_007148 [Molorchus minor]|uniref:ATP-dependent DNA helicase n=1 Tax=Molorchus minor TaxID=1323400 RepID=A0ABQ9J5Y2_9CUCU|nr:hypothetical protein NQ317_007148 [Molorchus minor]